jgi:hypothetical protein
VPAREIVNKADTINDRVQSRYETFNEQPTKRFGSGLILETEVASANNCRATGEVSARKERIKTPKGKTEREQK